MKNLRKTTLWFPTFLPLIFVISAYGQITPSADAYTDTATPTKNYGATTLLSVDSATDTTYIQFNLASIPSGASVSQATLKLYVNAVTTGGSFNVDYVNGAWAESTITSNLAPAVGATIVSSVPITAADKNQYILINVTSAVQAWLNGSEANDGIALVANSTFNATFDSKENTTTSHPAELDIVFVGDGTITGVTTASGSGLIGGGTSGTLNLGLTTACAKNQVLQWNGSAWACSSAGTGTITGVTAGTNLTGGGTGGNVTLNLNTTATNALYAQLAAANTFAPQQVIKGNGGNAIIGDPGCGSGFSGIGLTSSTLSGCNNYTMIGKSSGDVYLNSTSTGSIHFRNANGGTNGNSDLVTIDDLGDLTAGGTVLGQTSSSSGYGVVGEGATGIEGISSSSKGVGGAFIGFSGASGSGVSGTEGILARGGNSDPTGGGLVGGNGITAVGGGGAGELGGDGSGGYFTGGDRYLMGDGITATAGSGAAGYFIGDVFATGTITSNGGESRIDHPLDPASSYLVHASVESSERINIYTGNVTTDAQGEAVVQLPTWFEVLNTDFRYQLTVVGQFAQAIVSRKIENHQFQIRTNAPNVEVSWQVTGVRQDAYAKAHPLVVEEKKEARLKGYYIHPDLYGASPEKQIEWARHPQMMKKIEEMRASHTSVYPAR